MKKLVLALSVILLAATFTSCKTAKYGCPGVSGSGSSKPFRA
jgi:hypothetical protein